MSFSRIDFFPLKHTLSTLALSHLRRISPRCTRRPRCDKRPAPSWSALQSLPRELSARHGAPVRWAGSGYPSPRDGQTCGKIPGSCLSQEVLVPCFMGFCRQPALGPPHRDRGPTRCCARHWLLSPPSLTGAPLMRKSLGRYPTQGQVSCSEPEVTPEHDAQSSLHTSKQT